MKTRMPSGNLGGWRVGGLREGDSQCDGMGFVAICSFMCSFI